MRKPGKRVEFIMVKGKLKEHKVELRLDMTRNMFLVEFMDKNYENRDLFALKKELAEAAEKADQVSWTRWIEYEYDAKTAEGRARGRHISRTTGFEFSFFAVDLSDTIAQENHYNDGTFDIRLRRSVREEEDGSLVETNFSGEPSREVMHKWKTDKLIPWTAERWATFVAVRRGIAALNDTLASVLGQSPERILALLDGADAGRLLLGFGR